MATYKLPNTEGEARTAKFAYTSPNGNSYSIISVEDACDDKDYDDLLFALNPANVFKELPTVEVGKTTSHGVYAFEDKWPQRGDYDMNDVMLDYKHEMQFNSSGNVTKEIISFTTYQNYVTLQSGLALKLETKVTPNSIVMKKKAPGADAKTANFTKEGNYYYLTDNITGELGSTYIFEVTYSSGQTLSNLATTEPFLYRDEDGRRWEVHLPYKAPTSKMDKSYFGTGDDASNQSAGRYFVRKGEYPFAFYLDDARIEYFEDILKRENESTPINVFFPEFIEWSISKGKKNQDWYLHPKH
jgi:LruC domain-containing protein